MIAIQRLDQLPVCWIGADDAIGLCLLDELREIFLQTCETATVRQPRRAIRELEESRPELWGVTHRAEVGFLGDGVELFIAAFVEIGDGDFHFRRRLLQRFPHIACSGVVAVPEPGGKDEYFFHALW